MRAILPHLYATYYHTHRVTLADIEAGKF